MTSIRIAIAAALAAAAVFAGGSTSRTRPSPTCAPRTRSRWPANARQPGDLLRLR